jgi:hypothetical protein
MGAKVRGRPRRVRRAAGAAAAVAAAVLLTAPVAGGEAAQPRAVAHRPPAVPAAGAYFGVDPNATTGAPTVGQAAALASALHRPLGIVSLYVDFTQAPPVSEMSQVAALGSVPMVSMSCGATDAEIAAGKEDAMLRADAESYKSYGGPVFLRWFWEMNLPQTGNHSTCLGTGTRAKQDAAYVAAWRHIWTIFHDAGATNVAFVWAPSDADKAPAPTPFYPGNAYVDWIGADLYDRSGYGPWSTMYAGFYEQWSATGKPLMLSETGAVGSPAQATWISDISLTAPVLFPSLHAVVYVDAIDLFDYRLVPGTPGMAAFGDMGANAYFSQDGPEDGYLATTVGGGVVNYGCVGYGSLAGTTSSQIVGIAAPLDGRGYWLAGSDGSVYAFGGERSYGSMQGKHLNSPVVGIVVAPDGRGYWLVAADGGIFSFGTARFFGSMGNRHLNKPIVGIAAAPAGNGYWLVASDGGVFTFGSAKFRGSMGGRPLNEPIVGMAQVRSGYWLVAGDGGIFTFGAARYHGSLAALAPGSHVVGMATDPRTGDYRVVTSSGEVYQFPEDLQLALAPSKSPVVGLVSAD